MADSTNQKSNNFRTKNQEFKSQSPSNEDDWTNSCCDYQSEIFKEQMSCEMFSNFDNQSDNQNIEFVNEDGIFNQNYNPSPQTDQLNNLKTNNYFQGNFNNPLNQMKQYYYQHVYSQQKIADAKMGQNNAFSCKKLSLNQSGIQQSQPNSKSNITTVQSTKHQRKPFNSLVPEKINKNVIIEMNCDQQDLDQTMKENERKNTKTVVICEDQEQSYILNKGKVDAQLIKTQQSSMMQLTPQKNLPIPISPTQRPILSNVSSVSNNNNMGLYDQNKVNNIQLPLQKSDSKNQGGIKSSGQKQNVVYDEFKYYTQVNNYKNMLKMVNGGGQQSLINQKNFESGQQMQPEILQSEVILYSQQVEINSPKLLISPDSNNKRNNSLNKSSNLSTGIKKQPFTFNVQSNENQSSSNQSPIISSNMQIKGQNLDQRFQNMKNQNRANQILDQDEEIILENYPQTERLVGQIPLNCNSSRNIENVYEIKIKNLQDQVEALEKELKKSQDKNAEMHRKVIDKGVLQSFERSGGSTTKQLERVSLKHLSDTEDSLILSEKKKYRSSIHKSNKESGQNTGGLCSGFSQSQSSILDVKIKSINNIKLNNQSSQDINHIEIHNNNGCIKKNLYSKQQQNQKPSSHSIQQEENKQVEERINEEEQADEQDEQIQYQVSSFRELQNHLGSTEDNQEQTEFYYQTTSREADDDQQQVNQDENNQSIESQECESCERLKQLVFQAKEAIDDLKLEIEEWREISANKDTELRSLQHKIYNDLMGIQKSVDFSENVQTKEFDQAKPVNLDANKIKNFVVHNKKKFRSRSKNGQSNKSTNNNGQQRQQTTQKQGNQVLKKKSALKKIYDVIISDDDQEFYYVEDQCIQTSFDQKEGGCRYNNGEQENIEGVDTPKCLVTNNFPCKSRHNSITTLSQHYDSSNIKKQNSINKDINNNDQSLVIINQQQESLDQLKSINNSQEQEINRLKQQLEQFQKQCEQIGTLLTRVKRKNKQNKKFQVPNIDEIKQNSQIMSQLESYSILEKINEWKKEEGLLNPKYKLPQCKIPRPVKLIQEIDLAEIEQIKMQLVIVDKNDLNSLIRREKMQLQQLQDQKYQELIKHQNEYLQTQQKNMITSKEYSIVSTGLNKQQDSILAAVDTFIKKEIN